MSVDYSMKSLENIRITLYNVRPEKRNIVRPLEKLYRKASTAEPCLSFSTKHA